MREWTGRRVWRAIVFFCLGRVRGAHPVSNQLSLGWLGNRAWLGEDPGVGLVLSKCTKILLLA